jgi:hypothetical protein
MISARKGNGAPDAVVSGSTNAAARDTIPRMPVQPISNRLCLEAYRSAFGGYLLFCMVGTTNERTGFDVSET